MSNKKQLPPLDHENGQFECVIPETGKKFRLRGQLPRLDEVIVLNNRKMEAVRLYGVIGVSHNYDKDGHFVGTICILQKCDQSDKPSIVIPNTPLPFR